MINAPNRMNVPRLALSVSQQERREVWESEGDVLEAATVAVFGGGGGDADDGDAVVFGVVGEKGDGFVAVGYAGPEEGEVEVLHEFEV